MDITDFICYRGWLVVKKSSLCFKVNQVITGVSWSPAARNGHRCHITLLTAPRNELHTSLAEKYKCFVFFLHHWLQNKRKIQPGYRCPCAWMCCLPGVDYSACWVTAHFLISRGYLCFQNGFIFQDPVTVCLRSLLLPVMLGGSHQRAAGTAAPDGCTTWGCHHRTLTVLAKWAEALAHPSVMIPSCVSSWHTSLVAPGSTRATQDATPRVDFPLLVPDHCTALLPLRWETIRHTSSAALSILWLAAEQMMPSDYRQSPHKRNGFALLLFHSPSVLEVVLW